MLSLEIVHSPSKGRPPTSRKRGLELPLQEIPIAAGLPRFSLEGQFEAPLYEFWRSAGALVLRPSLVNARTLRASRVRA